MPHPLSQGRTVADNLVELANKHQTSDPIQRAQFIGAFKEQSKNDLCRTIVYLMEVIGSNDQANKYLEGENKDLREILKLNGIDLDKDPHEVAPDLGSQMPSIIETTEPTRESQVSSESEA